ncbi:MAG: MoaD/ThiS family protein [Candidatus Aminicenantes bacterium]|jgi:molybdopterin converting factor small subunit|nr:MoaD/ThiS family protein [Candidatus Aminicenantes bacterium]
MKITVKIIGPFIVSAGFSEKEVELAEGATAETVVALIKLDNPKPMIMTRNGESLRPQDVLREGDRVVIAPIYSGG